jgi:conserved oligomeric Golgi complex subunit 2
MTQHSQTSHPPRTPYTPFTAFASKQNPFEINFGAHAQAHLLDDSDDALASLYNTILRFVDRDMKRIMELAETVGMKTGLGTPRSGQGKPALSIMQAQSAKASGFDIMANVIWAEIGKAVMDELGSVVFSVGKPDEFRKVRLAQ